MRLLRSFIFLFPYVCLFGRGLQDWGLSVPFLPRVIDTKALISFLRLAADFFTEVDLLACCTRLSNVSAVTLIDQSCNIINDIFIKSEIVMKVSNGSQLFKEENLSADIADPSGREWTCLQTLFRDPVR